MKKIGKTLLSLGLAVLMVFSGQYVSGIANNSDYVSAATKIKLNKKKVSIYVGKTVQLKVTGTKKKVTWKTSNKKVATVTGKGKVKGVKKGTATITAKVNKKKYTCKVTVKAKNVKATATPRPVFTARPVTPRPIFTACPITSGPPVISWQPAITTEPPVITEVPVTRAPEVTSAVPVTRAPEVTSAVPATRAPEVTSAVPVTRAPEATKAVPVTPAPYATKTPVTSIPEVTRKPETETQIQLNYDSIELCCGETFSLVATVIPNSINSDVITWSSKNNSIAKVSKDGVITAVSDGNTVITASNGDCSASCNVKVEYARVICEDGQTACYSKATNYVKFSDMTYSTIKTYGGAYDLKITYKVTRMGATYDYMFADYEISRGNEVIKTSFVAGLTDLGVGKWRTNTITLYDIQPGEYKLTFVGDPSLTVNPTATPIVTKKPSVISTQTPQVEGETIRKNFNTLKNYISQYGRSDSEGNKFIRVLMPETDSFTEPRCEIIYYEADKKFTFSMGANISTDSELPIYVSLFMRMKEDDLENCEIETSITQGDPFFFIDLKANSGLREINGASDFNWIITDCSNKDKIDSEDEDWSSLSNNLLNIAYKGWDRTLHETVNLDITDLGFGGETPQNTTAPSTQKPISTEVPSTEKPVITSAPTQTPPATEEMQIQENFSILKKHILINGSVNSEGNRFITSTLNNITYSIVYNAIDETFVFNVVDKETLGMVSTLTLTVKEEDLANGELLYVLDDYFIGVTLVSNLGLKKINGRSNLNWTVKNAQGSNAEMNKSLANTFTDLGYVGWDLLLMTNVQLQITDFGFGE